MKNKPSKLMLSPIALIAAVLLTVCSQEKTATQLDETKAEVVALKDFHPVIYQIWHEAWPEKDYAKLAALLPEVETRSAAIAAAKLPGILHEKQNAWDEQVKELQQIVGAYKTAVETNDNPQLLAAAEMLHMQYEKLVKVIRPALKEIDDFHAVLYRLYHEYTPAYDLEKIRQAVGELQPKMQALNEAVLPERLKSKEAAFLPARTKLAGSVDMLAKTVTSNDEEKIKAAIETMHSDYEALQAVFE